MRGEKNSKLPLELYLNGISDILDKSLKEILIITSQNDGNSNFVEGYNIIEECLWPLIL
jgi:hypothetical protein